MSIPEGWKLVPVEPTPKMKEAGSAGVCANDYDDKDVFTRVAEAAYSAMLAAAPQPPEANGGSVLQDFADAACSPGGIGSGYGIVTEAPGSGAENAEFEKDVAAAFANDAAVDSAMDRFHDRMAAHGLEDCRLYAARHRKEAWAKEILRLCEKAGNKGNPLRSRPECPMGPQPCGRNKALSEGTER